MFNGIAHSPSMPYRTKKGRERFTAEDIEQVIAYGKTKRHGTESIYQQHHHSAGRWRDRRDRGIG